MSEKELIEKYPEIFKERGLPETETCMCWGLEIGEGWFPLVDRLCRLLQFHSECNGYPQVVATQVKEKFGELCFYHRFEAPPPPKEGQFRIERKEEEFDGNSRFLEGFIEAFENMSTMFCEVCGDRGCLCVKGGWYATRCPKHAADGEYVPVKESEQ